MKFASVLILGLILTSCASQSGYSSRGIASQALPKKEMYKIGEVKISLLKPAEFRSLYGDAWVLMDGSEVSESNFAELTGMAKVPDARGVFLRMQNNGRNDGYQNPDNTSLGSLQADAFQGHFHRTPDHVVRAGADAPIDWHSSSAHPNDAAYGASTATTIVPDGTSGAPRVAIETRPKSITVNYYVKINNCKNEDENCL